MTITTKLNKEQYRSASFAIIRSKRIFRTFAIVYLAVFFINILASTDHIRTIISIIVPPVIIFGLMYVIFSLTINRGYKNNPRFNERITYEFEEDVLKINGESFKSELSWKKFHKITKTNKWLLLWHNNQAANPVPMNQVSPEVLDLLKRKAGEYQLKNNI